MRGMARGAARFRGRNLMPMGNRFGRRRTAKRSHDDHGPELFVMSLSGTVTTIW
jgi:hypothetical protein